MAQIALISWSYSPFYGNETSQRRTLQIITQMYGANRKVYYLTSIVGGWRLCNSDRKYMYEGNGNVCTVSSNNEINTSIIKSTRQNKMP